METRRLSDLTMGLRRLFDKYGVAGDGEIRRYFPVTTCPAELMRAAPPIALHPWRVERKFLELRALIDNRTLEGVSTLRFAAFRSAKDFSVEGLLYREFDLAEWLGGSPVKRIFATFGGDETANVLLKLQNGLSCAIECGVTLPETADPVERHEIIAARGVASDLAVDTQIPQRSIYVFTSAGGARFTDTDAELYGLDPDATCIVRAAFLAVKEPETANAWNARRGYLERLVAAAEQSDRSRQPVELEVSK